MEKKELMIGGEIEIIDNFELESMLSKEVVNVKAGDKAIVRANGSIRYLTGEAQGMMQKLKDDVEVVQVYDYENIAKVILNRLNGYLGLAEIIEDAGAEISDSEIIDEIEDVLSDIL